MRGGAHVKEALGLVTLLWNHPVLTGLLLLVFTPPFVPLVVYFSPLLMSTALCVVALVSVGSQMEKIKMGQLETHLGREQGISRWVPGDHHNRQGSDSMERHDHYENHHRNLLYASSGININVVPAPPSWTGHELAPIRAIATDPEPVENHPPTPPAEEREDDWWDNWVKEYESRPGWGEHENHTLPTPLPSQTASQAPAPPTIPTPIPARQDAPPMTPRKPIRQDQVTREEKHPPAPVAAPVASPVSVPVVNRQEVSRSLPPPPTTSTSREEEVVEAVKESDLRPHISLAPIRTGREKRDGNRVGRIHSKPAAQASEIQDAPPRSVDVERVSDVQALQSIEKLLHMEMGADVKNAGLGNSTPQVSHVARVEAVSPQLNVAKGTGSVVSTGKGIAVEASEKNRNKIAVAAAPLAPSAPGVAPADDMAGETPLLRHLRTSRSEKQGRSAAYSPLPVRSSRGFMAEKVLPPPQFSPRLLQSLQPAPPKGFSPRLPNLRTVPLGNPVEKIPQWVYDGIPRERAEGAERVEHAEAAEETHIRAFEQAVRELSERRRRKHARRPAPIQVDSATLQARRRDVSSPNTPSTRRERTPEPSPHRPASRVSSPRRSLPAKSPVAEILPARISEDVTVRRGHESSSLDSTDMAPVTAPTPRASPRVSPSAMVAASPQKASIAASPRAASPQPAPSIAAPSPRPTSRQPASTAASPRPPPVASSPPKAVIAASPRRASRASSPHKPSIISSAPWPASIAASPQRASVASSPQKPAASIAASPRPPSAASSPHARSSVPSSPSTRRRHSTDKVPFTRMEGSTYYDPPAAAEEYVPIEEEVAAGFKDDKTAESHCITPRASEPTQPEDDAAALHWGRSTRKSRRRLEPRRVVTSQDSSDMFSLKKSFSTRNGETKKFVDSSSSDDERESVTPRASRRSMGRTIKPLVWRSRSVQAQEDSD